MMPFVLYAAYLIGGVWLFLIVSFKILMIMIISFC